MYFGRRKVKLRNLISLFLWVLLEWIKNAHSRSQLPHELIWPSIHSPIHLSIRFLVVSGVLLGCCGAMRAQLACCIHTLIYSWYISEIHLKVQFNAKQVVSHYWLCGLAASAVSLLRPPGGRGWDLNQCCYYSRDAVPPHYSPLTFSAPRPE